MVPGQGGLGASLESTHSSFETGCGAYGHFKITRYLLRITQDSRYGDSMERVLYNTIAGATPILADGTTFYYSDYNDHAGDQGALQGQVAVLFRDVSAVDGRLRHQFLLPEPEWHLRQLIHSLPGIVVPEQHSVYG